MFARHLVGGGQDAAKCPTAHRESPTRRPIQPKMSVAKNYTLRNPPLTLTLMYIMKQ